MTRFAFLALGLVFLAGPRLGHGDPIPVHFLGASGVVPVYALAEWSLSVGGDYKNPFDPGEVSVDGILTGPKGNSLRVPAFWYIPVQQNMDATGEENPQLAGTPEWRLRFAPLEAGEWKMAVEITDHAGTRTGPPISFQAVSSASPGFIRVAGKNPAYFEYDSGKSYFIVGLNIAYTRPWDAKNNLGPAGNYTQWLAKLAANGGNFARVWTNHLMRSGDPSPIVGPDRFDPIEGDRVDRILGQAESLGLGCMLTLGSYRDVLDHDEHSEGNWHLNPYNQINGGPVSDAHELFKDPAARNLYRERLRYLIARYSAFTSLACWELWNEQNGMRVGGVKVDVPVDWVSEMSGYLKAHDPNTHPVSTSFGSNSLVEAAPFWTSPSTDFTQVHLYGNGKQADFTGAINSIVDTLRGWNKPCLISELGIDVINSDFARDPVGRGTALHDGLWSAALSGSAGGACNWYWDTYVDRANVWSAYRGLGAFAGAVEWSKSKFAPWEVPPISGDVSRPETFHDLSIVPDGLWGQPVPAPARVEADGSITGTFPRFLFGSLKPEWRAPFRIKVNLPVKTTLLLEPDRVSQRAMLKVSVDEVEAGEYPFDASPGSAVPSGMEQSNVQMKEPGDTFQADLKGTIAVPIPPGEHVVTLENVEGDWLRFRSLTFAGAISSRYLTMQRLALADRETGEVLLWLRDPNSNWKADAEKRPLETFANVTFPLPVPRDGRYRLDWWDTRLGKVIRSDTAAAMNGRLMATAPSFQRDIALRATRVDPN